MSALAIGIGQRLNDPRVTQVELDPAAPIEALGLALHLHVGKAAWWSPGTFNGRRSGENWRGAWALAVDVDHTALHAGTGTWPFGDRVKACLALERAPATLAHLTPRGLRTIVLLDEQISDPIAYERAARALCRRVTAWLESEDLTGLAVDEGVSCDRARLLYTPRATVDGRKRTARIVSGAVGIVSLADLLREADDRDPSVTASLPADVPAPRHEEVAAATREGSLRGDATAQIPPGHVGFDADAWGHEDGETVRWDRVERARLWAEKADPAVQGDGKGYPASFKTVARAVRGFGLSDAEALLALALWNQRCQPPWDDSPSAPKRDSLLHLIRQGREKGRTPIGALLNAGSDAATSGSAGASEGSSPTREPGSEAATGEGKPSGAQSPANFKTFHLWEPAAIWAPLAPPDFLIDRLFVRGSLGLLVAYGSSFKTWLGISLALAVATGSDWLGMPSKAGEACFIDFESGDYELRRRFHKIAKGHRYATPVAGFTFSSMPSMSLADDAFFGALEPLMRRFAVIVIDSLAAGSGGMNKNDARFAVPLNRLKAMANATGCVVVLIRHSRKAAGDGRTDPREMVRGTSAIFNAVDVQIGLSTDDEGRSVLRQTKARGGKCREPFTVSVDDVAEDACRVTAGELPEEELAAAGKDPGGVTEAEVLAALEQAGTALTTSKLREAISVARGGKPKSKAGLAGTERQLEALEGRGEVSRAQVPWRRGVMDAWALGSSPDAAQSAARPARVR